jgi:hypothetical protein
MGEGDEWSCWEMKEVKELKDDFFDGCYIAICLEMGIILG